MSHVLVLVGIGWLLLLAGFVLGAGWGAGIVAARVRRAHGGPLELDLDVAAARGELRLLPAGPVTAVDSLRVTASAGRPVPSGAVELVDNAGRTVGWVQNR